jgi:MFS family permease
MSNNPYLPTSEVGRTEPIVLGGISFPSDIRRGWVGHVQILGVLMIVHGIIDVMAAIGMGAYAWLMPEFIQQAGAANGGKPMPPEAELMVVLIMGGIGVVFLVAGIGSILGGIWAIQFRRRSGVITGLIAGLAMLMSCYCFPTSLILMIYGLFVMLDPAVKFAFGLRQQGRGVKEIQQAFLELREHG